MTEEEASTQWCPFIRVFEGKDGEQYSNRPDGGTSNSYCIGSACMAWRWNAISTMEKPDPADDRWAGPYPIPMGGACWMRQSDNGFCGLAGKP